MQATFVYAWGYRIAGFRFATFDLLVTVERQDDGDPVICTLLMLGYDPGTKTGIDEFLPPELEDRALNQLSGCPLFLQAAEIALQVKEAALQETKDPKEIHP